MIVKILDAQGKSSFYYNLRQIDEIKRVGRGKYDVPDHLLDKFQTLAARFMVTIQGQAAPAYIDNTIINRIVALESAISVINERFAVLESSTVTPTSGPIVVEVPPPLSQEVFEQSLVRNYLDLRGKSPLTPRGLIADLRDMVCGELGISENIFDKELLGRTEQDPYRYQLGYGQIKGKKGIPGRKGTFAFFLIPEKELRKSGYLSEPQKREISDDEFYQYVEQAYFNTKERSDVVEIPKIRNKLIEYTGLSRDEIDLRLYRLFLQHKVDLQPGGSDDPSEQLVSDTGYRFYWFKFRPEREEEKKEEKKRERTIEDRTSEWLKMTQSGVQYELEGYTLAQMKQAAARILKTGDRRIKNKQKMIDRILKRMKEYRSRFEYGITREEVIKQEYDKLDAESPALGGVIEIPALWERVQSRISIDRDTFDETLKKLGEQGTIDLKFAMDTLSVKEPEAGIRHPKGLIYYVLYRDQTHTQTKRQAEDWTSEDLLTITSDIVSEEEIRQAYDKVRDKEPRFSAFIPFNYLKKELPQYDNEQINELLLELEKKRIVDLQVAYDASSVNEEEYGIELPGRGLVYFVRWR